MNRVDSVTRMTNLILALRSSSNGMTSRQIKQSVDGYDTGDSDETFSRKFRRDRKTLREVGISIESDESFPPRYKIDDDSMIEDGLVLSPKESAALRVCAKAAFSNPGFFLRDELASALRKICSGHEFVPNIPPLPDEDVNFKARSITESIREGSLISFDYVDSKELHSHRSVIPKSVFSYLSDWYLYAFDVEISDQRVFKLERMSNIAEESIDASIEVTAYSQTENPTRFPFQVGTDDFIAKLYFGSSIGKQSIGLTWGKGKLDMHGAGYIWTINAKNRKALMEWVVQNGPGILIVEPCDLNSELKDRLHRMACEGEQ